MSAPTSVGGGGAPAGAEADGLVGSRTVQQFLKDVGLFFAAPFITLAYLVLFPFIGLMMLVRSGKRASGRKRPAPH